MYSVHLHSLLLLPPPPAGPFSFTVSDIGSGTETISSQASFTIADTVAGSEVVTPAVSLTITDLGTAASEIVLVAFTIQDTGFGVELAWRVQGEISIDGTALPRPLEIVVTERTNMDTRAVNTGLPSREFLGKLGRAIRIRGWTRNLTDLQTLENLADGAKHLLILPTGDSLNVLVSNVRPTRRADEYGRFSYQLDVVEEVN